MISLTSPVEQYAKQISITNDSISSLITDSVDLLSTNW